MDREYAGIKGYIHKWNTKFFIRATCVRGITGIASARHGKVMGSMLGHGSLVPAARLHVKWYFGIGFDKRTQPRCSILGPNHGIAKDVKSFIFCCYVKCVTLILGVRRNTLAQKGAIHYHAQLGLPGKGRRIKELVVCRTFDHIVMHIISKIWLRRTIAQHLLVYPVLRNDQFYYSLL